MSDAIPHDSTVSPMGLIYKKEEDKTMNDILKELYYKLEEAQKSPSPLRETKSYDKINEIEEELLSSLEGNSKKLFIQFSNMYGELLSQEKLDAFERGVRVGVELGK